MSEPQQSRDARQASDERDEDDDAPRDDSALDEDEALAEDRGRLGQGQGGIAQQGAERRAQGLVHGVAEYMGQGQHVALNTLTNDLSTVAQTVIDFPAAAPLAT